ncbi:MAG: hypothetical protein HC812_19480 [Leptolyngbya sp. RL_3_1]|nr:hypothetical protein [Leptolyngbya sp. RL_3_1]
MVAYGRLTSSGAQQRAETRSPYPHEQAQLDQAALTTAPATEPAPGTAETGSAETTPTPEPEAAAASPTVSIWSLGLLVALCAGGCFALSHSLSASRRAPRRPGSQRRDRPATPLSLKTPRPKAAAPLAPKAAPKAAPKRMQPYRPMPGGPGFASAPTAQASPSAVNAPAVDAPAAAPAAVTVVSEESANPLDWPQDSLINRLDVRQRRSVSSWLSS